MAKNAKLLELGPANVYLFFLPKASLLMTSIAANSRVFLKAYIGGASGNSITVAFVDPGAPSSPLSVSVSGLAITVSLATNAGSVITSTANDVIAAIRAGAASGLLVSPARKAGEAGSGVVSAQGATALAGGSDTGVKTDIGFVGESVAYQVTTEVGNLTGAQTGNVAQDKVVIGGMVRVVVPFKEISLDNFQRGIPLARLVENSDASKRRVDFGVSVGLSLRSIAVKMLLAKIKGGFESALPADQIVIPEISPAEGEVNFPFAPTAQREIATNWYAWPNADTGRWAFTGDEFP